jgi:hypothetical protein
MGPSTRWTPNLHNRVGHTPTTQLGAPKQQQPSRVQRPKSNKLTIFTSTNLRGEHKPMQLMQWQEHTRWSNPSLSNSNKATNAYGGIREEEQRKSTNESPRTRSTKFPSLRGGMDWWKCGSRSPLSFPSRTSKNHWRD